MNQQVIQIQRINRSDLVRRGKRPEYFTIGYNSIEGLIAIIAGLFAGSIALVGFGFDYLSAILLGGLLLNALLGWWWADPLAALLMVPIIVNEGAKALRGKTCCDEGVCH
jgi:divalent metal cation (Fe/Co/Zn/Cd) transporter